MPSPLDDPDAAAYLEHLVQRLEAILEDRLIGAWLVNSGAWDDYVRGSSDLDVTVGVADRLEPGIWVRLADALRHKVLPCPAPRLELVIYRRAVLADPGSRPDWEVNLNTGPAVADHVGTDPSAEPAHWFVLDLSMAHDAAVPLVGPPLAGLLGPIPDALVIEALQASWAWHEANDTAAPNRVLNLCRAWRWLEERRWSSKSDAADWAIAAGGDAELIALAMARRRGRSREPLPVERVAAFASAVEERMRRR